MGFRVTMIIALILVGFWDGGVKASPSTKMVSQYDGTKNEHAILKYLLPALSTAGKVGRIYYQATCQADDNYPAPFPKISVQPQAKGSVGLAAIRDIFQNDKNVRVTEGHPGVVSVIIGKVPVAILRTRISLLTFKPMAQYNYSFAFTAINNSVEIRAARLKLGLHIPSIVSNEAVVQPAEGLPHLPSSMKNITMDQALDVVAKTFGGIVVYGACVNSKMYTIDFTGGAGFDYSKLQ